MTYRQDKGLTAVARGEVAPIVEPSLCSRAVEAFNKAFAPEPETTTQVHVIRFGSTRYVVADESRRAGQWIYSAVFDSSFAKVLSRGNE